MSYLGLFKLVRDLPENRRMFADSLFRPIGNHCGCVFGEVMPRGLEGLCRDYLIRALARNRQEVREWLESIGLTVDEADAAEDENDFFLPYNFSYLHNVNEVTRYWHMYGWLAGKVMRELLEQAA